jgi:hypothetical protein
MQNDGQWKATSVTHLSQTLRRYIIPCANAHSISVKVYQKMPFKVATGCSGGNGMLQQPSDELQANRKHYYCYKQ